MTDFPTDIASIRGRLSAIDPARYASTRNSLSGAVTCLSPYLTHGALTLPQIRDEAFAKAGKRASYKLVFELAWREYFQRVWWERGEGIFSDIKRPQSPVRESLEVPSALLDAETGIRTIDASIEGLYETGYVHNHARMWTAMLGTNVAQVHWKPLAAWYYYHLLDGDLGSNTLSWQWVAGTFSSKKYRANQENLNKFDPQNRQSGTFLDVSYETLEFLPIPEALLPTRRVELACHLPAGDPLPAIVAGEQVLLYHPWSLDPTWRSGEPGVRLLVLEPSHFQRFPISPRRMEFLQSLAENITGLSVFVGEVGELPKTAQYRSVAHPATRHWPGAKDAPAWLFDRWPEERTLPGSFMGYWSVVEKWL
jgi:deoxyribodipyrimidine photo-lyase